MDAVTQQNSALVEESAATAELLEQQVGVIATDKRIAGFQLRDADGSGSSNAPAGQRQPAAARVRGSVSGQAASGCLGSELINSAAKPG